MTRYDAWSELDPALAEALRSSLYTGDWSAWEPDVVEAFRRAFDEGDWSGFDPQIAATIRAAIGQETVAFEARSNQERSAAEAKADRELAAVEADIRSKYSDYAANRQAILKYAIKSKLPDLDHAYRAWRSSQGYDGPALAGQSSAAGGHPIADMEKSLRDMDARLKELKSGDLRANDTKIRELIWQRDDLRDKLGLALVKGHDPEQHRRDLSHDYDVARSARIANKSARVSKAERNAALDLEALDIVQGRTKPPTAPKQSRADRAAENAGLDARDRQALALIHGDIESDRPTTEAVIDQVTSENE